MNRPIKFRVWDFFHKQWITGAAIELNGCIINTSFAEPETNCVALQYTGLTDKNGKEIYEGDILKNPYDVNNKIIGQVLYESDYGGYIFQWKRRGQDYKITNLNCDVAFHSAIVGNIFEHSELLK
jgi:uncharacterized phage protein (TIGR01671 family)